MPGRTRAGRGHRGRRVAGGIAAAGLLALGVATVAAERRAPARRWTVTPAAGGGCPPALVVVHPGLSDFPRRIAEGVARGLGRAGYCATLATAGHEMAAAAPRPALLVLVAPTYWWTPARPVLRDVATLAGGPVPPVLAIVTASGQGERARRLLVARVEAIGGRVMDSHAFYRAAPNDEGAYRWATNEATGVRMAEALGARVGRVVRAAGGS